MGWGEISPEKSSDNKNHILCTHTVSASQSTRMKQGPFEITLFDPNSDDYEERVVDGKVHFVAVVGREFKVRIKLENSCGLYPRDGHVRVDLIIDGVYVYHATFSSLQEPYSEDVFDGYVQPFGYRAFVFRGQSFPYDALPKDFTSQIGMITLKVSTVLITRTETVKYEAYTPQSTKQKEEAHFKPKTFKQLWEQPSACTGAGCPIQKNQTRNATRSTPVDTLAVINVPYHTAYVLDKWQMNIEYDDPDVVVVPPPTKKPKTSDGQNACCIQ